MNTQPEPRTLVFVIHGLRGTQKKMEDLKLLLEDSYPNSVVLAPEYPHTSLFSATRAAALVMQICDDIDKAYAADSFDRIILVGHSMGCVLARRALIEASGTVHQWPEAETPTSKREAAFDGFKPRPWASKVTRLLMFASISRGWSAEHTKSPLQGFQWRLGGLIGHILPPKYRPTLFDFRRGCPFIVMTRLRWLEFCAQVKERPQVVQFLGTQDNVAPPNDTIDFVTAKDSDHFIQVELPHSNHSDLLTFSSYAARGSDGERHAAARRAIVQSVLEDDTDGYEDHRVKREWFFDELPAPQDTKTKNLVFVIHGIRDRGFWTQKIAARIKETAETLRISFVSRTPSYGYFPILPFLLPWYRRQKVEWFMDQYVEAAALYPNADMHFLGHSNGTYLAARALEDYPSIGFKRVFFAGSVVRTNYEWARLVAAKRVDKILNVVATKDLVVAAFPYGLRHLQKVFDLGGAGHAGFATPVPGALYQVDASDYDRRGREYVEGGHRAGREEELWADIAKFFVTGDVIEAGQDNPFFRPKQPWKSRLIGRVSPGIVFILAAVIIGLGVFITRATGVSLDLLTAPDWSTDRSFWSAYFGLPVSSHLLIFGAYVYALRFMAIRF